MHQFVGYLDQDFQQITFDQIGFGHTARDIAAVVLHVGKLQPPS